MILDGRARIGGELPVEKIPKYRRRRRERSDGLDGSPGCQKPGPSWQSIICMNWSWYLKIEEIEFREPAQEEGEEDSILCWSTEA